MYDLKDEYNTHYSNLDSNSIFISIQKTQEYFNQHCQIHDVSIQDKTHNFLRYTEGFGWSIDSKITAYTQLTQKLIKKHKR